jgi:hypothetical protein
MIQSRKKSPQTPGHLRQLGRSTPHTFDKHAKSRFGKQRRASYLRRVGGEPDDRQAFLIDAMLHAEWTALQLEAKAQNEEGKTAFLLLQQAAEYRRQLLLADRELARATKRPVVVEATPNTERNLRY